MDKVSTIIRNMSNINDEEQKLVKKVVNKKRLKKLAFLGEYASGLKGIVDYPDYDKQRKALVKGIPIPHEQEHSSDHEVAYLILRALEKLVGGEKQTAKIVPLNDFQYKYKESDKSLKDDKHAKYHEWSMILAKKNSKRLGFSLGDLLFRIQNKKDKSIVYPEMRAFDGYEVDSIFEGTSYFLTDEDMYKVADDKYNVIRE